MNELLLKVRGLQVDFAAHAALRDVNIDLYAGETLGLVGESGAGKTTLGRAVLRLVHASAGSVDWRGRNLLTMSAQALRAQRRELQIVFQDPLGSLNPRMRVGEALAEPLRIFEPQLSAAQLRFKVDGMLERVGLSAQMAARYPHEFSGGQCQRIGIARAMILRPKLLVCDEPVSSLDVSIQGQIVNLLLELQRDCGTAMLFIGHNLALVRHVSHRILVMYLGRIVEVAARDSLFGAPLHPYTRALMSALPGPAHERYRVADALGSAESMSQPRLMATGCPYRDRCPYVLGICETTLPPLQEVLPGHKVACHRSQEALIPLSLPP